MPTFLLHPSTCECSLFSGVYSSDIDRSLFSANGPVSCCCSHVIALLLALLTEEHLRAPLQVSRAHLAKPAALLSTHTADANLDDTLSRADSGNAERGIQVGYNICNETTAGPESMVSLGPTFPLLCYFSLLDAATVSNCLLQLH